MIKFAVLSTLGVVLVSAFVSHPINTISVLAVAVTAFLAAFHSEIRERIDTRPVKMSRHRRVIKTLERLK
jgi:hypothetical protein